MDGATTRPSRSRTADRRSRPADWDRHELRSARHFKNVGVGAIVRDTCRTRARHGGRWSRSCRASFSEASCNTFSVRPPVSRSPSEVGEHRVGGIRSGDEICRTATRGWDGPSPRTSISIPTSPSTTAPGCGTGGPVLRVPAPPLVQPVGHHRDPSRLRALGGARTASGRGRFTVSVGCSTPFRPAARQGRSRGDRSRSSPRRLRPCGRTRRSPRRRGLTRRRLARNRSRSASRCGIRSSLLTTTSSHDRNITGYFERLSSPSVIA